MRWKELRVNKECKQTIMVRWMNKIIQGCLILTGIETWLWKIIYKEYEAKVQRKIFHYYNHNNVNILNGKKLIHVVKH